MNYELCIKTEPGAGLDGHGGSKGHVTINGKIPYDTYGITCIRIDWELTVALHCYCLL